jgi:hypothetical protein
VLEGLIRLEGSPNVVDLRGVPPTGRLVADRLKVVVDRSPSDAAYTSTMVSRSM